MEVNTSIPRPAPPASSSSEERVQKLAQDFEAVFVTQMVNHMMDTSSVGSFGGGSAEQTWRSLLGQEYGKSIAESNATGIRGNIEQAIRAYQNKQ